jgi:stress response protein SCP2
MEQEPMKSLLRGEKVRLKEMSSSLQGKVQVRAVAPGLSIDFSCFGLDAAGQLSDDRYLIFYNQPASPEKAIRLGVGLANQSQTFEFDLSRLPSTIRRLIFVATIDGAGEMKQLQSGHFLISLQGVEAARFGFSGSDFSSEKALIVGEIYFKDVWRVGAVGQGFSGGLSALLKHFGGVEIEDSAAPKSKPVPASTCSAPVQNQPPAWAGSAARTGAPTRLSAASFALPPMPVRNAAPASGQQTCARCAKIIGWIERARGFNEATKRCKACDLEVEAALQRFRVDFEAACARSLLSPQEWEAMWSRFDPVRQGISPSQALDTVRGQSLRFEEEDYIALMVQVLRVPAHEGAAIKKSVAQVKEVARVREGYLPVVAQSQHHLEAGEVCHLETNATYHKVSARSSSMIHGKLVATSKRLHFVSPTGGWTILYKNVMRVQQVNGAIHLELSTRSNAGRYAVANPLLAEAVVTTLTKLAKRQMLEPSGDRASRHIPQDVRLAVWQRDGASCVQCQAREYLEYDHIIPHSRGGASTLANVQLLCRNCNLKKGDRI